MDMNVYLLLYPTQLVLSRSRGGIKIPAVLTPSETVGFSLFLAHGLASTVSQGVGITCPVDYLSRGTESKADAS